MKFLKTRSIDKIQIPITTVCNRSCPHCYAKLALNKQVFSYEYLQEVGRTIGEIGQIEISGGEATTHPDFEKISNNLQALFSCRDILLATNGYIFKDDKKLPLLLKYQRVWLSHYNDEFVEKYGGKTNTEIVNKIEDFINSSRYPKPLLYNIPIINHVEFSEKYNGIPCDQYRSNMISCFNGKIYGCCVSWSIDEDLGVPLSKNWRQDIYKINIPCEKCVMSNLLGVD